MTRLVNIFLRGAADGLSILAPVADPSYRTARPTLAVGEDVALDVGIDGFGFHPSAPRLASLVRARAAAVVPAAGYPGQTRSHFESQALLEAAVGEDGATRERGSAGWLGAQLAAASAGRTPASSTPFRAVAVGVVGVPPSLRGTIDALGVPDPAALALGTIRQSGRGRYRVVSSTGMVDPGALARGWEDHEGAPAVAVGGVVAAAEVLARTAATPITVGDPKPYGTGATATSFAAAAALLDAGLGTEVVQVDLGGWDTHRAQGTIDGTFAALVGALDAGIGGLVDRYVGRGEGLVISVMTEFGRRVRENSSGGTDHGRGGVALVIGDGVDGGLRGSWPGLAELDNGDVPAVNDLRVVQSEVAAAVFGRPTPTPAGAPALGLFGR